MKYICSILSLFSFIATQNVTAQCVINKNNLKYSEFSDEFNYTSYETLEEKWFLTKNSHKNIERPVKPSSSSRINIGDGKEKTKTHVLNGKSITLKALKLPSVEWVDINEKKDELEDFGRKQIQDTLKYERGSGHSFYQKPNSTDCQIPVDYRTGNLQLKAYPYQNEKTVLGNDCWSPNGFLNRGLTYGYYEIRMRVRGYDNMYAFWLYNDPDEIDVYESIGYMKTGHNYSFGFGQHIYPWGRTEGDKFTHYWDARIPYTTKENGDISRSVINVFRGYEIKNLGDEEWVVLGLLYTKDFWSVYINDHEIGRGYDHQTIGCPMDVFLDVYVSADRLADYMMNEEVLYEWEIDYFRHYEIIDEKKIFSPQWMVGLVAEKEDKIASQYRPQLDNTSNPKEFIGIDQFAVDENYNEKSKIYYVGESGYIYNLYYDDNGWNNHSLSLNYENEEKCGGDLVLCKNRNDRNQLFFENIEGWVTNYYFDNTIRFWKHGYLTTDWNQNEKCGGAIKVDIENNHVFYRTVNDIVALYWWDSAIDSFRHDFLINEWGNAEEKCLGDLEIGEHGQIFYRNGNGVIATYKFNNNSRKWIYEEIGDKNKTEEICRTNSNIVYKENKLYFINMDNSIVRYTIDPINSDLLFENMNPLNLPDQKCFKSLSIGKTNNIYFVNSEGYFSNYYLNNNEYKFSKIRVSSYFDNSNGVSPTRGNVFLGNNKLYYVNENGDLATLSYGGNYCEGIQTEWIFYDYEFWNDPAYSISYIDYENAFQYTQCDDFLNHTGHLNSGDFYTIGPIITSSIISSPNIVSFISNISVSLTSGFETKYGAELNILIDKCE